MSAPLQVAFERNAHQLDAPLNIASISKLNAAALLILRADVRCGE